MHSKENSYVCIYYEMASKDNTEMTKELYLRLLQDSNLRENVPMDFKSITLTTRSNSPKLLEQKIMY